jgi:endonuclease/exonuclease/phosphatase (EEP) superfamily protein YafD
VLGLQECSDRGDVLTAFTRRTNRRVWVGLAPGAPAVPILYHRSLDVEARFSRLAVPRMYVGRGAGPSWSKAKAVTGIRVGDLVVLNTHMIASLHASRLRRLHYRIHVAVLVRMVRRRLRRGLRVVLIGDFNAEPDHRLLKPLRDLSMGQQTNRPTHGARMIDLIWTRRLSTVSRDVVRGLSSDHRAAFAVFNIAK